jgi:hypothetical protein
MVSVIGHAVQLGKYEILFGHPLRLLTVSAKSIN